MLVKCCNSLIKFSYLTVIHLTDVLQGFLFSLSMHIINCCNYEKVNNGVLSSNIISYFVLSCAK